jgi:hypothetical protein
MVKNMVLMGILGPKTEKLTGFRVMTSMLCTFNNFFIFSGGKIKEDEMGGHVTRIGREGKCTQVFGGET